MGLIRTKHPIALYRNVEILQQVSLPVPAYDNVDDKSINLKLMKSRSTSYGVCYETRPSYWRPHFSTVDTPTVARFVVM